MKYLLFVTALFTGIFTNNAYTQKYAKSQFTLFAFSHDIDDKVKLELSPLEGSIHFKPEKDQNAIEAMIIHTTYALVSKTMEDSLGSFFMPTNTFTNKTKYDDYGYPDMTIQKAIRLGDTKYFLRISLIVENDQYDNAGKKVSGDIFKPKVTLTLSVYNKYGFEPLQSAEAIQSSVKAVKLFPEFLAGMNMIDPSIKSKNNNETLYDILNRATLEAVLQLKYKKKNNCLTYLQYAVY